MAGKAGHRTWREDNPHAPADLRLVPAATALWVGCLVGLFAGQIAWWAAVVALVALVCVGVARMRWWPGWAVVLVAFAAAIVITMVRSGQQANDPLTDAAARGSWATVTATVSGFPREVDFGFTAPNDGAASGPMDVTRWRIAATIDQARVAGLTWTSGTTITVDGTGLGWSTVVPGERIETSGRLGRQEFGAGQQQIVVHARDPPQITTGAPWWYVGATAIREALRDNAARLSGDAAGLLPGLVVGDTGGISDRLEADAKITGITHLLAVSGSHFAILCGLVVVVLRRLGPRWAAVGGSVTVLALVVLVGPQPSVVRAALMGSIGMLALLSGRTRSLVPALATAVIVLLLIDPDLAVSAGFTLSVLATGGLILIAPVWSTALQRHGVPRGWADAIAVPVAAQVVTMPVIVLLSGSVSVVGVLANLLVAPVVAPALVLGVGCALTGPWWPGAAMVTAHGAAPLLNWICLVAHTLARWPNAALPWPATPVGAVGLAAATVAAVLLLRRRRFRLLLVAIASGAAVVAVPARLIAPGWPAPGWLLTACEVGQGDAMVLSTGERGTAVVVDTGPEPDLVDACLDRLGIGTIALLILTHLHADHVDGLTGALDGRSVGAIAVGPGREPAPSWRAVQSAAADRGIDVVELIPGVRWASGELTITALAPGKAFHGTDSDPNNDSLVVMAQRNGERMLMTGDIEVEAQQALLNTAADLDADVLKVPHHGSSKLLDSFVRAVSPTVAVIGVGAANDYGHPSRRAVDLLTRDGVATILRTDQQGDVAVGLADGVLTATARGASTPAPP